MEGFHVATDRKGTLKTSDSLAIASLTLLTLSECISMHFWTEIAPWPAATQKKYQSQGKSQQHTSWKVSK